MTDETNKTTIKELRKALRRTSIAGTVGICAVVFALTLFVIESRSENDKICDIVNQIALGSANALITATAPGPNATEAELEHRAAVEKAYLHRINATLEGCR